MLINAQSVRRTGISMLRRIARQQSCWSARYDRRLPGSFRVDGNLHFLEQIIRAQLEPGVLIYDVGGGKNPAISAADKKRLRLRVNGVDISQPELNSAPPESYDDTVCADISRCTGPEDGDIVICQALLEHVKDTEAAMAGLESFLKPGGKALIFVPSRNAVYARLNLLLPASWKMRLLDWFYPDSRHDRGFPAFYNRCTPAEMRQLVEQSGFQVEELRTYFTSNYFSWFFPLHVLWRVWLILFRRFAGEQAAETFSMVLRKRQHVWQAQNVSGVASEDRIKGVPSWEESGA